jgi:Leucine-rich repeat (LRR) protein
MRVSTLDAIEIEKLELQVEAGEATQEQSIARQRKSVAQSEAQRISLAPAAGQALEVTFEAGSMGIGLQEGRGARSAAVERVLPSSVAARGGLIASDTITSVGGVDTRAMSYKETVATLQAASRPVRVLFWREVGAAAPAPAPAPAGTAVAKETLASLMLLFERNKGTTWGGHPRYPNEGVWGKEEDLSKWYGVEAFNMPSNNEYIVVGLDLNSMYGRKKGITDLTPIANLAALRKLRLDHCTWLSPSSLDIVAGLPLTELSLGRIANSFWLSTVVAHFASSLEVLNIESVEEGKPENPSFIDQPVVDIAELVGCTALTTLCLKNTKIASIGPLSALAGLTALDITGTRCNDITPLAGNAPHMVSLTAEACPIVDISVVASMGALQLLNLEARPSQPLSEQVSDFTPIAACTSLTSLNLESQKQLSSIGFLSGCKALEFLSLRYTKVADIAPIASSKATLEHLDLSSTDVNDLQPLTGFTKLRWLDLLGCTEITNLEPLHTCTALTHVNLNGIRNLDLTKVNAFKTAIGDLYRNTPARLETQAGARSAGTQRACRTKVQDNSNDPQLLQDIFSYSLLDCNGSAKQD